ncbi:MAG TPA: hypothetical protein PKO06_11880 [Candidatus Ozemobacteraceae bacterium]|mgnify:CR=1 FL=1|nr:hypothetical protein [Candidatus Ozemobacteraceae bacterium]
MNSYLMLRKLKEGMIVLAIIGILLAIVVPNLRKATTTERMDACCTFCGARTIKSIEKGGVVSVAPPQLHTAVPTFDHQHFWVPDGKVERTSLFGSSARELHGTKLFVTLLELQTYLGVFGGRKDDSRLMDFYLKQISKLPDSPGPLEIDALRLLMISNQPFAGLKGLTSEETFWKTLEQIDTLIPTIGKPASPHN